MTKLFKKSLALMLTLAICLSAMACCFIVSAEGETTPAGSISFVLNDEGDINPNDNVTIDVVADWTGVAGAEFTVTGLPSDATVATTNTEVVLNLDATAGTVKFVDGNNGELSDEAPLFSISFTAGAKDTTYTFEIDEDTAVFCNLNEEDVTVTCVPNSFEVVEKQVECTHANAEFTLVNVTETAFEYTAFCSDCSKEVTKTEKVGTPVDTITPLCTIQPKNDIAMLYEIPKKDVDGIYSNLAIVLTKETYLKDSDTPEAPAPVYMTGKTLSAVYTTYYEFKFSNISAYEMNNKISAVIYGYNASNEWVRLGQRDYSVVDYVLGNLNNTKLRPVLVDMVVYGSYMQTYCGQNVKNLAIDRLSAEQQAFASGNFPASKEDCNYLDASVTTTVNGDSTTSLGTLKVGRALTAGNKINLQFVITTKKLSAFTDEEKENLYCVVDYYQDKTSTNSITYHYATNGTVYNTTYASFTFDKAPVSMLDYPVKASFYYGDPTNGGVLLATNTYSVETYIADNLGSSNAKLVNVLKSMYAFGNSLATYAAVDPYTA